MSEQGMPRLRQTERGQHIGNGAYDTNAGIVRKYICKTCGCVFNDHTGTAYEYIHLTHKKLNLIIACLANGAGVNRTADVVKVTPKTVINRTKSAESTLRRCLKVLKTVKLGPFPSSLTRCSALKKR